MKSFFVFLLLELVFFPTAVYGAVSFSGLGQCHWVGGPYGTVDGIKWGYSSSTPFDFYDDSDSGNIVSVGDSWAAVEPNKGEYHFEQMRLMVDYARGKNKKVWLQIQVADAANKEHNVPKWALDEGVETVPRVCGNKNDSRYWKVYDENDGYLEKIKPYLNNPRYADTNEAELYNTQNKWMPYDGITVQTATKIRFPKKIAAIWDLKFRSYYLKAHQAMKDFFQKDIDDGVVAGINFHSGGEFGESFSVSSCFAYSIANYVNGSLQGKDASGNSCSPPDILNPNCPAVISLAKSVGRTAQEIAQRSNCAAQNTVPGNFVQLCDLSVLPNQNPNYCPVEKYSQYDSRSYACYAFDDYWMQSIKLLADEMVKIWAPLPLVWQRGSGLSSSYRNIYILQDYLNSQYANFFWFKFNGWGPRRKIADYFFKAYPSTMHGYEPDVPSFFGKSAAREECRTKYGCELGTPDANSLCSGKPCCDLTVCYEDKKRKIREAIYYGIVKDKSSFLCLQSDFYISPVEAVSKGNEYFFNPNDNTPNCDGSEIKAFPADSDPVNRVGWCPGFLNTEMSTAGLPLQCFPRGDINCSTKVSLVDFQALLRNYGTKDKRADLDNSQKVDMADAALLLKNFGK